MIRLPYPYWKRGLAYGLGTLVVSVLGFALTFAVTPEHFRSIFWGIAPGLLVFCFVFAILVGVLAGATPIIESGKPGRPPDNNEGGAP